MFRQVSLFSVGAAALALGATGCSGHDHGGNGMVDADASPYFTTIDAGHTLSTNLGDGAAVFVEYASGGRWHVWTSCDTAKTGLSCDYRLHVYPRGGIQSVAAFDFEANDRIDDHGDGTLTFVSQTALDSDGMALVSKPGALLDVELELDGYVDPTYLVWYGNDAVHEGAPRSPVVFQPDAP
jgi:hypothetical protein